MKTYVVFIETFISLTVGLLLYCSKLMYQLR